MVASHASLACPNMGKLAKVRNKSSGGSSNLYWGELSPFLIMGVRVRLEGGNCRPPTRRSPNHLSCPGFSHITHRANYCSKYLPPTFHANSIYDNLITPCPPTNKLISTHLVALVPQQVFLQLLTHLTKGVSLRVSPV